MNIDGINNVSLHGSITESVAAALHVDDLKEKLNAIPYAPDDWIGRYHYDRTFHCRVQVMAACIYDATIKDLTRQQDLTNNNQST